MNELLHSMDCNAWAQSVSKGKYKTLRSLMGAIHKGDIVLVIPSYNGIKTW